MAESVPGPAAERADSTPAPPGGKRRRSGSGLYVELPREMKVELDIVAATLQVPLNALVGAVLSAYVSRERTAELEQLVREYRGDGRASD
ncbi:MAG: hypothetical protein ACLP50_17425 [Solirubrobacteraceae bacterium]